MTAILEAAATKLDEKIARLARHYRPLAVQILKEAIRIPADFLESDPKCGLSGHELPRLEYLRKMIIECGAVDGPDDVWLDPFGNLVWVVQDVNDGIPREEKKVVMFDGHTDTVNALRERWHEAIGGGIDPYYGWIDRARVDREFLSKELGYLPPGGWESRMARPGQLAGVVSRSSR
jgi:acetylornithine deacetylase/succinyl-diaminopimelate desuccinylase-like protein